MLVHEVLGHGAAGVRGDVLERRGVRGPSRHDDGVIHRVMLAERFHQAGDGRLLLPDGHVHADDAAVPLVDDRVDRDRRLARLAVADDQLALAAADGDHAVDGLDAGLQRHLDGLAPGNAGGDDFERAAKLGLDRAAAVERAAQRIHHPADERLADGHAEQPAGGADLLALHHVEEVAQHHGADRVLFQVEHQAHGAAREFEHLRGHGVREPEDAGHAVPDFQHPSNLGHVELSLILADLFFDDAGDFVCLELHACLSPLVVSPWRCACTGCPTSICHRRGIRTLPRRSSGRVRRVRTTGRGPPANAVESSCHSADHQSAASARR